MSLVLWLFLFCKFIMNKGDLPEYLPDEDERVQMGKILADLAEDIIKEQAKKANLTDHARYDNKDSAAYEVGYMTQVIHEHYRKMLIKWESVKIATLQKLYNFEMVLLLEEIEHLYWAIKHEVHMLHEVERKYQIKTGLDETYEDPMFEETTLAFGGLEFDPEFREIKVVKPFKVDNLFKNGMIVTTRERGGRFKIDYGWEIYEWNSDT